MITAGERWRHRLTQLGERAEDLAGRVGRRVAGWSVRRRVVFGLVPLVLCAGGAVVAVPLLWFVRATADAGRGAATPDAAANDYLMALGYANDEGLLPVLDDERQDELLSQWRSYRAAMDATDPPPSKLDYGVLTVRSIAADRAEVTTDVQATWWSRTGGGASYNSAELRWRFETIDDNGWRVSVVEAPAWCGGYARAERCRTS